MLKTLITFLLLLSQNAVAVGEPTSQLSAYGEFQSVARRHEKRLETEGISYMVGGGIGLVTSTVLMFSSTDQMSQVGFSLVQILSAGAGMHGAQLYFSGDAFTAEAERLRSVELLLKENRIRPAEAQHILNRLTEESIRNVRADRQQLRLVRGSFSLALSAAIATSVMLNKGAQLAVAVPLGLVGVVSLVSGIRDVLQLREEDEYQRFETLVGMHETGVPMIGLRYRY